MIRKPPWLSKKINLSACRKTRKVLRGLSLHTVCEEAFCPNISECFKGGVATFMILGKICTRKCRFCGVSKGKPAGLDDAEPKRVKEAAKALNLKYVVITSPARDDLDDGGAGVFCKTVEEVKGISRSIKVEVLIPDFSGKEESLKKVAGSSVDVIAHNLETVPALYAKVRRDADYRCSLDVLRRIKKINQRAYTKSGIILGLGEKENEVVNVLRDLRKVDCDFLTLGQYLPPSLAHYPLKGYLSPERFRFLEKEAFRLGFRMVKSGPYVRSSYLAHLFLASSPNNRNR